MTTGMFTVNGKGPTFENGVYSLEIATNNDAVIFAYQNSGIPFYLQTTPPPLDTTKLIQPGNGGQPPPIKLTIYNPDMGAAILFFMTDDPRALPGVIYTIIYNGKDAYGNPV